MKKPTVSRQWLHKKLHVYILGFISVCPYSHDQVPKFFNPFNYTQIYLSWSLFSPWTEFFRDIYKTRKNGEFIPIVHFDTVHRVTSICRLFFITPTSLRLTLQSQVESIIIIKFHGFWERIQSKKKCNSPSTRYIIKFKLN